MNWKKKTGAIAEAVQQDAVTAGDEALFAALQKTKQRKRRRTIRIIVILVLVLVVGLFVGTRILQRRVRTQFAQNDQEVLSAQAERGSISTLVSGSGMLTNVDTEVVSVPSGVEVTEILVKYGDTVEAGDVLATVDMATVRTALADLQEQIASLDKDIAAAKGDSVSSTVSAKVSGRVKVINAVSGDLVEDVMVESGSLAVLSLDGYMLAELNTDALSRGDSVTVVLPDGSEVTGKVDSVIVGKASILLTDDGPMPGDEVTIRSAAGEELGSTTLSIHNPMAVTGYAGTVSRVRVSLNQKVSSGTTLFTLSETATTAAYDTLLRTRSEYEETLLQLLQLQHDNALTAPISGSVYSVAKLDSDSTTEVLDIVTLSPDKEMEVSINVDESDILSLEPGQTADITVRSVGDQTLQGVVTEIDKTYSSGNYAATITLDKVSGMIPGMTASVDIRIEGVDDAILIPADALHQTGSGYYVYTSYDEETQEYGGKVTVVPGLSNSNYVEIKSGLNEGDTVYYTKTETFTFDFSSMGGFSGGSNFGGEMPSGSGGGMPSGGSGMPSGGFSGGGSGTRPSGGMPSGFGG